MMVAVEGGEHVLVVGDNFGPAGTPVIVEPEWMLRCDHSNTSHTRIACVTLPGRGDGLAVHVTVEGQRSDTTNGGGNTDGEVGRDGAVLNRCVRIVLEERVHLLWVQRRPKNDACIIKRHAIEELVVSSLPRHAVCRVETLDVMDVIHKSLAIRMLPIS